MRKKGLLILLGIFAFCLCVKAQSIRVVEDTDRTQTVSLNGKAEAVFVANSDKMFIETSRPSLDTKKSVKKGNSGQWEYVFELQLQTQEGSAPARTFTITQSGSANKTTFKKGKFLPNKRYYFIVETVKNPIFLVDNTQPTDVHLKNDEASIEINSISEVEVIPDPKLSCSIIKELTQAGYYSTLVVVDMKAMNAMRNEVQRQQMIYEDLNESLLERAERQEDVSESEWMNLQTIQQRKEEAEAQLADVSLIRIKAKDSNELNIDISDLQVKQKRIYTVETSGRGEEEAKPHWMLLANYGYSPERQHSLGLTLAWAGRFGGYLSFMTNGSFGFSTDLTATMNEQYDYLWSDKTAKTRMAVTAGGLFAVKKLGYVYAGVGYGIRNLVWYTESNQSVAMSPGTYKGVALEAGMMFNIGKHMLLSAGGLVQFPGPYYEMKVGLGYKF
ncbi:MAG: porin family protein [Bacteroidales bacterium]|nr:porin family protein [Bacteroidales bacterium]